jgi:hypothetical protein
MKDIYQSGNTLKLVLAVADASTGVKVDPGSVTIYARFPPSNELQTYTFNGVSWTTSESAVLIPSRTDVGIYRAVINVPASVTSAGEWLLGWVTTANGSGLGRGSGESFFHIEPLRVLL